MEPPSKSRPANGECLWSGAFTMLRSPRKRCTWACSTRTPTTNPPIQYKTAMHSSMICLSAPARRWTSQAGADRSKWYLSVIAVTERCVCVLHQQARQTRPRRWARWTTTSTRCRTKARWTRVQTTVRTRRAVWKQSAIVCIITLLGCQILRSIRARSRNTATSRWRAICRCGAVLKVSHGSGVHLRYGKALLVALEHQRRQCCTWRSSRGRWATEEN